MSLKIVITRILCSPKIGKFLSILIPIVSFKGIKISTRTRNISNTSIAALFWGLYEKAESGFVNRYLNKDLDVIELGSSIGVVSNLIAKKINPHKKVICIEPGNGFTNDININFSLNNIKNFKIISKAYAHKADIAYIDQSEGNNVSGKVFLSSNSEKKLFKVETISLFDILTSSDVKGNFSLVCDIEGMEVELFDKESDQLEKCQQIIIETHTTEYNGKKYTPDLIRQLIESHGYFLVDQKGPVFVFSKIDIN